MNEDGIILLVRILIAPLDNEIGLIGLWPYFLENLLVFVALNERFVHKVLLSFSYERLKLQSMLFIR